MQTAQTSNVVRFGPFEADLRTRELRKYGRKLRVQDQPFQVLAMLLEHPGELVTREEIRARLWPEERFGDFDHGLNAAVRRLREALNDNADAPRFVETLPRRGYRFIATVQAARTEEPAAAAAAPGSGAREPGPEAAGRTAATAEPEPARFAGGLRGIRPAGWMVAAAVFLLACAAAARVVWRTTRRGPAPRQIVQRQLTANPSEMPLQAAALSPDGEYLAYSDRNGLHLQLTRTGQTQSLSAPKDFVALELSWLQDGTGILASGRQGGESSGIWLFSPLGGAARKLRDHAAAPEASPDGTQIAFLDDWETDEAHGISVMNSDGENARRVIRADAGQQFFRVRWAPDGKRLAFTQSVRGRLSVNLPQAPLGSEALETAGLDGSTPVEVVTRAGLQDFVWLRDGRMVFSLDRDEGFAADSNLWAVDVDAHGRPTAEPRQLTDWAGNSLSHFSSTHDGKKLAFLRFTSQSDVYVGKLEQNGTRLMTPRRLTLNDHNDWPEGWMSDSSAVIFWSDRNGGWDVFRQRVEQDGAEAISVGPGPKWYAHFSGDGAWLLYMLLPGFEVPGSSLPVSLMRVPAPGGQPQKVLDAQGMTDFRCARSRAAVCVLNEVKGQQTAFTRFDPVLGRGREVFREESKRSGVGGNGGFDVSPDGQWLAVVEFDPQAGRLRLVSLTDGTSSDVVVKGWNRFLEVDWAPDGRGLYVGSVMLQGGAVLYVDLQGHAQVLWQQAGDIAACGRPSPDGRLLAVAGYTTSANAWMIGNY